MYGRHSEREPLLQNGGRLRNDETHLGTAGKKKKNNKNQTRSGRRVCVCTSGARARTTEHNRFTERHEHMRARPVRFEHT